MQLKPCEIHKDKPLPIPELVEFHTYVVRIFRRTSTKEWFATVAKDAIQSSETTVPTPTKEQAIAAVRLK